MHVVPYTRRVSRGSPVSASLAVQNRTGLHPAPCLAVWSTIHTARRRNKARRLQRDNPPMRMTAKTKFPNRADCGFARCRLLRRPRAYFQLSRDYNSLVRIALLSRPNYRNLPHQPKCYPVCELIGSLEVRTGYTWRPKSRRRETSKSASRTIVSRGFRGAAKDRKGECIRV